MNLIQKPEMVFIDFDGVISKNAIPVTIKNFHRIINQYTPLPYEALLSFSKNTMCFSPQDTLSYLFKSLGIEDKLPQLYQEQTITKLNDYTPIIIESDFERFIDFCEHNTIPYLIYSTRDQDIQKIPGLIKKIGKNIYDLKGRSKANFGTFTEVAKELKVDLHQCMYIDDSPLALRTGKLHGMTTAMMLNDVFTLEDYQIFSSYIDYKIDSFTELETIFTQKSTS